MSDGLSDAIGYCRSKYDHEHSGSKEDWYEKGIQVGRKQGFLDAFSSTRFTEECNKSFVAGWENCLEDLLARAAELDLETIRVLKEELRIHRSKK